MIKKLSYLLLLIIMMSMPLMAEAKLFPEGTPTRAIQDLDKLLDTYIVVPKNKEEIKHNRILKKQALQGTFDIRTLAKISMAKNWDKLTTKQQNHFVDVLSQLLERKAVFAKEQGDGGKSKGSPYIINYSGHKKLSSPDKSLVESSVTIPAENLKISLNYKLLQVERAKNPPRDPLLGIYLPIPDDWEKEQGWKIYDVIVDDASLLDNYRYQFDAIIRKGGYEDLIRRMESKLASMKEKEQKVS